MSFYPLAQPLAVSGSSFSFKDITPFYPHSPIGWGAPNAPVNAAAITTVWGEVQPYGEEAVQSTVTTGSISDTVTLSVPVSDGVNIVHLYYGEFIPFSFTVSADRLQLTYTDTDVMDAVKALSIGDVFPAKVDSVTDGVITLQTPLDSTVISGTHLFRYFNVQINLTPLLRETKRSSAQRVPPVAQQLSMGARITGNGFNLKWTVLASELTNSPRFVAIGSSTFAGSGATTGNSVAARLAAKLTAVGSNTAALCNNAASLQDTRYGLPDGSDPLTKENRNISMAMAANPTAIVIAFPTNDIGNGLTPEQFRDNIQLMYSLARKKGIPTFVISPQPRTGYNVSQQNGLLTAATLIRDIIPVEFFVDVMEALRDPNSSKPADINPIYNADNIHPNDAGHEVIYNILWNRISSYFTDPVYTGYTIESATVSSNGEIPATWIPFDTITAGNTVSKTYPRADGDWHAYRIIPGPDTLPSDPIWIRQPLGSSTVAQTVQLDLSLNNHPAPPADWNNFTSPPDNPLPNQSMALNDITGTSSGITVTVAKTFYGGGTGGANANGVYPIRVMQDFWYLSSTIATKGQLVFSGLSTENLYNIEFTSSRDTPDVNRIVGLTVTDGTAVDKRDGMPCVTAPVVPTLFAVRTLEGIVPDAAGLITLNIHCAGPNAYLNGLVIRKMNT